MKESILAFFSFVILIVTIFLSTTIKMIYFPIWFIFFGIVMFYLNLFAISDKNKIKKIVYNIVGATLCAVMYVQAYNIFF